MSPDKHNTRNYDQGPVGNQKPPPLPLGGCTSGRSTRAWMTPSSRSPKAVRPSSTTRSRSPRAATPTAVGRWAARSPFQPERLEDITVSVTDTLDAGGTCSITETAPYVVPKSDSLVLHYTCSTNGSTTKNTATVTWNKTLYFTPLDTASDDADVVFGLNVETNKTITVIDDKTDPLHP